MAKSRCVFFKRRLSRSDSVTRHGAENSIQHIGIIALEKSVTSLTSQVGFVLVETSHPGNIGAAARALKTMSLQDLSLVAPKDYPCAEATARAAGADDLLAQAPVYNEISESIAGRTLVFGTTARMRSEKWPCVSPREAAALMTDEVAQGGKVAVVFGRERSGLNNDELAYCHQLIRIPVNPDYSSLNLAAAVQVVAYELMLAQAAQAEIPVNPREEKLASMADQDALLKQLDEIMDSTGFTEVDHPGLVRFHMRRLLLRAIPTSKEIKLLHGILRSIRNHL